MYDHLASWLFTYALHSTVLLLFAWLVTARWIRSHAIRDVIWKTALVGALVTATLQSGVGFEPVGGLMTVGQARVQQTWKQQKHETATAAANEGKSPVAGPIFNSSRNLEAGERIASAKPATESIATSGRQWFPRLMQVESSVLSVWAIIAAALLTLYIANRLRLVYRLGARRTVVETRLLGILDRLRNEAGMRRPVVLTAAPGLASPVALGTSEIALPEAALTELGPDAQESMLAHELTHLSRRDPQWLTFACVVERIFFFQPLNRLARVRMQEAAEFLCDDWAARRTGSGLVLAKCLVKVAEWIDTSPQPVPLSAMAERRSQLVSRIHRLIENHAMRPQPRRVWLVPAAVVLVLITAFSVPGFSALPSSAQQSEDKSAIAADTGMSTVEASLRRVQLQTRSIERRAMRQAAIAMGRPPRPPRPPEPPTAPMIAMGVKGGVEWSKGAGHPPGDTTGAAVPALLAALKDADVEVRRAASQSLGNLQDSRAVPGLIDALKDSDAEVRANSAEALGNLEDPRAVSGLTVALKDNSTEVRRRALEALANMPESQRPVDAFIQALSDSNADVRQAAVEAVSDLEDKRAVRPLIKLLSDPSADVRHQAAHALGNMQDPSAADPLAAALRDSDSDVRSAAASSLAELGLTVAPVGLIEATKDKNAEVRQNAAHALGEIRDPKSVPTLRVMLNDQNSDVREAAIDALSEVRDSAALEAIIGALKSSDPNVRKQAAEALGQRSED
jgi:HEAT repeat protein/beta-lactamase regulating signal transducer with metallopeptidase domain